LAQRFDKTRDEVALLFAERGNAPDKRRNVGIFQQIHHLDALLRLKSRNQGIHESSLSEMGTARHWTTGAKRMVLMTGTTRAQRPTRRLNSLVR
jgi:hypothetical protein